LYFIVFYCEIHLKYCQDTINRQFNSTMENNIAGKTACSLSYPGETNIERWEKETNIVKGARFCYCRSYHKFVNFIILKLFKVVKWKSCFILIFITWHFGQDCGCDTVRKLMHQTTQQVNKHWHGRKGIYGRNIGSNTGRGAR
jgi:hypothetical protein